MQSPEVFGNLFEMYPGKGMVAKRLQNRLLQDMHRYAAAFFETLAGRGHERIIYFGEKSIIEWIKKKGQIADKKRKKYLRENAHRPSPTASAQASPEGLVALGNDDNFYLVKKDKNDKIIEGSPDKIKFVSDVWKFTKNIKNSSPNWYLAEIVSQ